MDPIFVALFWLMVAALAVRTISAFSHALLGLAQLTALAGRPGLADLRPIAPPAEDVRPAPASVAAPRTPAPQTPPPAPAPAPTLATNYLDTMSDDELDGLLKAGAAS